MGMNIVALSGRFTKDPEVRVIAATQKSVCNFDIAVNRNYKNADGNYDADFFKVVAFGKTAEYIEKYGYKGGRVAINGSLENVSYTNKDGIKITYQQAVVKDVEIFDRSGEKQVSTSDGFINVADDSMDELPFV